MSASAAAAAHGGAGSSSSQGAKGVGAEGGRRSNAGIRESGAKDAPPAASVRPANTPSSWPSQPSPPSTYAPPAITTPAGEASKPAAEPADRVMKR